jgi:glucose-6-phosphate isomerase
MGFIYEAAALGGTGLAPEQVEALRKRADEAAGGLADIGFVKDLSRGYELPAATDADRVVVLGIGGSALGARAVHAVCEARTPIVVVDNIDPEALEAAWAGGDPARTAWVVVSKSGGTTETLTQLSVVRERLGRTGGAIHVVTGARGPLRELADAEGLPAYPVPEDVGGRFSVFTPAATVPLALAGHDVAGLLKGARAAAARCSEAGSVAARLAALLVAGEQAGRNVVTLWTYAERLETVGEWFRQLWAESLGKQRADGSHAGQTPVHCVGSTDQHSMQQLMVEGPRDKVALVLAGPPTGSIVAPDGPGAGAGHDLASILDAMRRATTAGMVRAGSPAATFKLDAWSEEALGTLLMTFLCATVLAGGLLEVDPFGQPGVEAAKVATRELLGEPGGETDRDIARLLGEGDGVTCP